MNIITHRNFQRQFQKLSQLDKEKFTKRRDLFLQNPFDPILKNHALHGKYSGFRSINITGDIRVIHYPLNENTVVFFKIGSHSELYE